MLSSFAVAQPPAYKNKNLSPEARAKDLVSRMNLDEKGCSNLSLCNEVVESEGQTGP